MGLNPVEPIPCDSEIRGPYPQCGQAQGAKSCGRGETAGVQAALSRAPPAVVVSAVVGLRLDCGGLSEGGLRSPWGRRRGRRACLGMGWAQGPSSRQRGRVWPQGVLQPF